jgi:hypothetical protein
LCSTHKGCGSDDKTPDDNVRRLRSAQLGLADAINTAAEQAIGRSNLTSLEIDLANGDTVVWQIKFGGRSPRALLNAISGGVLEIGLDAD